MHDRQTDDRDSETSTKNLSLEIGLGIGLHFAKGREVGI